MKASKLIENLQLLLNAQGDLDVVVTPTEGNQISRLHIKCASKLMYEDLITIETIEDF